RLLLSQRGKLSLESTSYIAPPDVIEARIAAQPVSSGDPSLRIKTNRRGVYNRRLKEAGTEEVLLWNERGEATEFCKGNLVVKLKNELFTPPEESGLLPGILRRVLLERGDIAERKIPLADLRNATEIYRINSLTGWAPIRLIKDETNPQKDVD